MKQNSASPDVYGAVASPTSARPLPRRLYALKDAAPYLGGSLWTFRKSIWRGELPHVRIGRNVLVDLADLDRYILSHKATYR